MKKSGIAFALALAIGVTSFQGCIGNFVLSKKVLNFNQHLSNKFVNEIVFLILWIIPVYEVCIFVDMIILNSCEFWLGTNPLAMEEGQIETKYVSEGDVKYQIDITKNRYHFLQLEGPNKGEAADLLYNPDTKTWSLGNGKVNKRIVQNINDREMKVFTKSGDSVIVSRDSNPLNLAAALSGKL